MTEAEVTKIVARKHFKCLKANRCFINTTVPGWEADLVSVSRAGYLQECEVKISASDFRADLKKAKHRRFILRYQTQPVKQFWYAMPVELADKLRSEIPAHAGLLGVSKTKVLLYVDAPILPNHRKLKDDERASLETSAYFKLWTLLLFGSCGRQHVEAK